MAFKQNNISAAERIEIGLQVLEYRKIYGFVTDLARKYSVSRWFIYFCFYFVLQFHREIDAPKKYQVQPAYVINKTLEEQALILYLDTKASISDIRHGIKNLTGEDISAGQISQILNKYGELVGQGESINIRLKFMSDEIFINNRPVLVTVEPGSGFILRLDLADKRDGETWGCCWLEIVDNETGRVERIVADQAKGIIGGIGLIFDDAEKLYQTDLFHVIVRLAYWIGVLERQSYSAINNEYEAARKFQNAKSENVLESRLEKYEAAKIESDKLVNLYDDFVYLFRELQNILMIMDMKTGDLRKKNEVIAEIDAILCLMEEEIDHEKIQEGVRYFRCHQDAVLRYFDDVEEADEELKKMIPDEFTRQILVLIYGYQSQSYTAYGQRKRYLKEQIDALKQMLDEYAGSEYAGSEYAGSEYAGEAEFERLYPSVEKRLSSIIRSSSMVENTNSRLRPFFDAARGQINQNRLNLIRFYLNHKVFQRGRRKGKTPAQMLYGKNAASEHWLSILQAKQTEKKTA